MWNKIGFAFLVLFLAYPALVFGQTSQNQDAASLLNQIMAQVNDLKVQLADLRTQVQILSAKVEALSFDFGQIKKGETGETVRRLQYSLRQHPSIYPEGLVTGYYGDLTEKAVKKFQVQNGLNPSGVLDKLTAYRLVAKTCTPTPVREDLSCPREPEEEDILARLNESGKQFYYQSKAIRDTYSDNHPYKKFLLISYSLEHLGPDGYFRNLSGEKGGTNCFVPNPSLYSDIPTVIPDQFYRYVKDCPTRTTIQRQIIDTTGGYLNYIGRDRYSEQCILDGSFDVYYVESIEKLE